MTLASYPSLVIVCSDQPQQYLLIVLPTGQEVQRAMGFSFSKGTWSHFTAQLQMIVFCRNLILLCHYQPYLTCFSFLSGREVWSCKSNSFGKQLKFAILLICVYVTALTCKYETIHTEIFGRQIISIHAGSSGVEVLQCNQETDQADYTADFYMPGEAFLC